MSSVEVKENAVMKMYAMIAKTKQNILVNAVENMIV
jgi:hypothetical protein